MARLETWYKQDLKKPLIVHKHSDVFNQDSRGNLIGVEVYSNGEPVTLAGSISGYCLLADGTTVPAVGASRSGNKASVLIPQTAYSIPGPITITIKNVEGNDIATLCAVVGLVRQSVSGNLVNPGSVVTDWSNSINAQLQAVQTAADNVGAIVAAPFNENTVYVAGNYVTNNGNLYEITGDHAAGVAWADTSKVQRTVGSELSDLKSALSNGSYLVGEQLSDLDNGVLNHSHRYGTNSQHAPNTNAGDLFVVGAGEDNKYQIAVDSSGEIFYRAKWGGSYRSWEPIQIDYFAREGLTGSGIIGYPSPTDWTDNVYVDSDGSTASFTGACASGYFDVEGFSQVLVATDMKSGMKIVVYDKNYEVIGVVRSAESGYSKKTYSVNTIGGAYIRISSSINFKSNVHVVFQYDNLIKYINNRFLSYVEGNGNTVITRKSVLDKNAITRGHYLNANESIGDSDEFGYTDWIDITGYDYLEFDGNGGSNLFLYYDAYKNKLGHSTITNVVGENPTTTLPGNTVYCRFNIVLANLSGNDFAIHRSANKLNVDQIDGLNIENTSYYTLGTDFVNLASAFSSLESIANEYNRVVLYIPEGEWDSLSGVDLSAQASSYIGPIVPDYVDLVGLGSPENVIIKAELPNDISSYAFSRNNVSTLNLWRHNNMKNIKVVSKSMRYPVHNDKAVSYEAQEVVERFENCIFYADGVDGVSADNISFGSGVGNGGERYFVNCVFESTMNPYMNVNCHNRVNQSMPCMWDFEHCDFVGGRYGLLLTSYNSGQTDILNFRGCRMNKQIIFQTQLASRQCDYKLWGFGNSLQGYVWNGVDEDADAIAMMLN